MGMTDDRLGRIQVDDSTLPPAAAEAAQERLAVISELLEDNSFRLAIRDGGMPPPGPYALILAIREGRLVFDLGTETGAEVAQFHLSFGPLRQIVKDYRLIRRSYFDAVKRLPSAQLEAVDMARRGIHNEGARALQERLKGKVIIDIDTARRLFTLICTLQQG